MLRLVIISDTHGFWDKVEVPAGDVLIHCGDFGHRGKLIELPYFNDWLGSLPHPNKLFVAGNHDWCFYEQRTEAEKAPSNATYLQDTEVIIESIKFYGSPWQPRFNDYAFNLDRGEPLAKVWSKVPNDTQVLLTHSPSMNHCDRIVAGAHVGCADLERRVAEVRPLVHAFGHVHEARGCENSQGTLHINASFCDERFTPRHKAWVVDVDGESATIISG